MVKMKKSDFEKRYLRSSINKVERKIVVAKEYIQVIKMKYNDKIESKLEKNNRKNRKLLLPLEKSSVSRKEYHQNIIDEKMKAFDENQYWQKRASIHKLKKETEKKPELLSELNKKHEEKLESLTLSRKEYLEKLELKYPLTDLEKDLVLKNNKDYQDKKQELETKHNELREILKEKYDKKYQQNTIKNDNLLVNLNEKLNQLYKKRDLLFELEKDELKMKRDELKRKLDNNESLDAASDKQVFDEIESLFEMYEETDDTILRVKNLTMAFGGLKAVDNLSFDVKKGEIFGLIGPNGAGKTTVFNCVTQFYKPTSGKIYYKNNEQVTDLNDIVVHDVIRQGIVRTFQNVELIWELSILDNLLVAGHTLYRSGFFTQLLHLPKLKREEDVVRAKALRILDYLDLTPYKDIPPIGLPYGLLKRIELARTFMTDPKLIILDEPAAGLNDTETLELAKLIKKIREDFGTTIFLVEHDMGLVMDVCDSICAISFGKKLAFGTPLEIQKDPKVQEAYLGGE